MLCGACQMLADECCEPPRGVLIAEWIAIAPDHQRTYLDGAQSRSRDGIGPGPA